MSTQPPTWLSQWGPTVVPLIVSLVALAGVVWSSWRTTEAVINAEDLRHRHALDLDRQQRIRAARHKAYEVIETSRIQILGCAARLMQVLPFAQEEVSQWKSDYASAATELRQSAEGFVGATNTLGLNASTQVMDRVAAVGPYVNAIILAVAETLGPSPDEVAWNRVGSTVAGLHKVLEELGEFMRDETQ